MNEEIEWTWKSIPHQLKDKILVYASAVYNSKTKSYNDNLFLREYTKSSGLCAGHICGQGIMHHPLPIYDIRTLHRINRFLEVMTMEKIEDNQKKEMRDIIAYFFDNRLYSCISKIIRIFQENNTLINLVKFIPPRYEIIYYFFGEMGKYDRQFSIISMRTTFMKDDIFQFAWIVSGHTNIYSCEYTQDSLIEFVCELNPQDFLRHNKLIDWALSGIRGAYIENIFIRHSSKLLSDGYTDIYKLLRQHSDIINTKNKKVLDMIHF